MKKAAALLRKEEREEGEANQRDLEGVRKRDSGKAPEGGQVNNDQVKTKPPKGQEARRGAETKTPLVGN